MRDYPLFVDLIQKSGDRRRRTYTLPMKMTEQDWKDLVNAIDDFMRQMRDRLTQLINESEEMKRRIASTESQRE